MIVIRWLGQACFLITSLMGTHILIDPPNPQVGYPIAAHSIPAKAVFVSHEHPDHNWTDAAAFTPQSTIIQPIGAPAPDAHGFIPAPNEIPPEIDYTRIFAYHDNVQGTKRGTDTITVMDVDGLRICHLGDLGELQLTPDQIKSIGPTDILIIPVGGFYTIDGNQAAAIVAQLKPRVIIPMHYGTVALNPDLKSKLAPATAFLAAMKGHADIVDVKARDLDLKPGKLPKRETVYVLRYMSRPGNRAEDRIKLKNYVQ